MLVLPALLAHILHHYTHDLNSRKVYLHANKVKVTAQLNSTFASSCTYSLMRISLEFHSHAYWVPPRRKSTALQ